MCRRKDAFDNAWNEPADGPHTFYYNSKGELTSTNESRASKKNNTKTGESDVNETEESQQNSGVSRDTDFRYIGNQYYGKLVKSQFLKLTKDHLEYVSDCMDINLGKVNNIRAYLVTALYNAPTTFSNHVAQIYRTENHSEYESEYDVQSKQKLEYMKRLKEEDFEKYKEFLKQEIERQRKEGRWDYHWISIWISKTANVAYCKGIRNCR